MTGHSEPEGRVANIVETDRAALAVDAADTRCPGCFGWGFPIVSFGGRETFNTAALCLDCGGTGNKPAPTRKDPR